MKYCVYTPKRGQYLKPDIVWFGNDKSFRFIIIGEYDSDYADCPFTRRSLSGFATFWNEHL